MIAPDVLALLPDDVVLTVQVRAGDLRRAVKEREGGPEIMSPRQAAERMGWTAKDWRRWAGEGLVPGAVYDEGRRRWHLPREGCRSLADRKMRRVESPTKTTTFGPRTGGNHGKPRAAKAAAQDRTANLQIGPRLER